MSSSCLCPIHWSHVLSWEWRCSWSSADRRCSKYIWVINNFIAYWGASYMRDLTVIFVTNSRRTALKQKPTLSQCPKLMNPNCVTNELSSGKYTIQNVRKPHVHVEETANLLVKNEVWVKQRLCLCFQWRYADSGSRTPWFRNEQLCQSWFAIQIIFIL